MGPVGGQKLCYKSPRLTPGGIATSLDQSRCETAVTRRLASDRLRFQSSDSFSHLTSPSISRLPSRSWPLGPGLAFDVAISPGCKHGIVAKLLATYLGVRPVASTAERSRRSTRCPRDLRVPR